MIQVEARDRNREAGTVTITLQPKKASFGALRNPFAARLTFKEEKITAEAVELDETELATEGTLNADDRVKLALRCGPAYLETGREFFEGVCGRQNPQLTFRDPPPPLHKIRESFGRACTFRGCALDSVGAHDQPLLEGGVGGARLQRYHVPPQNLPHYPNVGGIGY